MEGVSSVLLWAVAAVAVAQHPAGPADRADTHSADRRPSPVVLHVSPPAASAPLAEQDGSATYPFHTVQAAQVAIRALSPSVRCRGVTVTIHPGVYSHMEPLLFGSSDSGCSASAPIIYQAAQQFNTVRIDGGIRVASDSFRSVAGKSFLQADLPSGVRASEGFNRGWQNCSGCGRTELFFGPAANLQPMVEARHPNIGPDGTCRWMRQGKVINSTTFEAGTEGGAPTNVSQWANAQGLWAHGFWHYDWADTYERVLSISPSSSIANETPANEWVYTIDRAPHYGLAAGSRYYVVGALELLDSPGEYMITNDSVYFYPPGALSSLGSDDEVVLSAATNLVTMQSTSHVEFVGLSFGVVRDLAVNITGSTGVVFRNCSFANVGGTAVMIDNADVQIQDCHLWGIGCTAISIANVGNISNLRPGAVEIVSNRIHNFARVYRTVQPGVKWEGVVGAQVRDNEIFDAPHVGIIGARGNDNIFDGNYLHDLCGGASDAGAFYAGRHWDERGNVVSNNRFSRIYQTEEIAETGNAVRGIYLDDMEAGWVLTGNYFDACDAAIFVGGGRQTTVVNNTFTNCTTPVSIRYNYDQCGPPPATYPAQFIKELEADRYLQPPWSKYNITIGPHPCAPEQLVVTDNRWCDPGSPSPTPPSPVHPKDCAACPTSNQYGYGDPTDGNFCCAVPLSGGACTRGICCLRPGDVKVTKFGKHGCQGLPRCGNNPTNKTACPPISSRVPRFTDYYDMAKAFPNSSQWGNILERNVQFTGCV